jgi:ferritin-like protein
MTSESLHEDAATLGPEVIDRHRAIVSLMEELEAVDWYDQRVKVTDDAELRAILAHNRDEEKEHAAMILEWLRRHDAVLDVQLRNYLFRAGPIHEMGGAEATAAAPNPEPNGSLPIGSLRERAERRAGAAAIPLAHKSE